MVPFCGVLRVRDDGMFRTGEAVLLMPLEILSCLTDKDGGGT